jgi:hypothetical protein
MKKLLFVLLVAGCQDDISTPFPPGLEPFDDDAETLTLDASVVETLSVKSTDEPIIKVYGRGFIFAPPAEVYAEAHDPEVMLAACSTTSHSVDQNNEPDYDLSYLVSYFVDNILNVEWDDQWRGDVVEGTLDAPTLVMIKHQKTEGSDFITTSEGTVALYATDDPAITEVRFVEHLDALMASEGDVIDGMQSNYDRMLAVAHGQPIPSCVIDRPPNFP